MQREEAEHRGDCGDVLNDLARIGHGEKVELQYPDRSGGDLKRPEQLGTSRVLPSRH
jgi:hypothetical protein